jgi:hypothetical protein
MFGSNLSLQSTIEVNGNARTTQIGGDGNQITEVTTTDFLPSEMAVPRKPADCCHQQPHHRSVGANHSADCGAIDGKRFYRAITGVKHDENVCFAIVISFTYTDDG